MNSVLFGFIVVAVMSFFQLPVRTEHSRVFKIPNLQFHAQTLNDQKSSFASAIISDRSLDRLMASKRTKMTSIKGIKIMLKVCKRIFFAYQFFNCRSFFIFSACSGNSLNQKSLFRSTTKGEPGFDSVHATR